MQTLVEKMSLGEKLKWCLKAGEMKGKKSNKIPS